MNKEFVKELDNIFILGRGQSLGRCPAQKPEKSEFWGCNNVYRARQLDRLFLKTDIYLLSNRLEKEILKHVNENDIPIYTLGAYPEIKNNFRIPVEEIIKEFKTSFLINTASYMLALAIMQKPKNIYLAGIDMEWGTNNEYLRNEKGCVEYWLGVCKGRGIKFVLAEESTLLKRRGFSNYYGLVETTDGMCTRLEPKYSWGRPDGKSALHYKIILAKHNL